MEIVIVDDEQNAIEHLLSKLNRMGGFHIKETFTDSCKALAYLIKNKCDVLFLDIDMPNINGIYIAEQLSHVRPDMKICFITGHDEFAVRAFELAAIDYLLKPYSDRRLEDCLKKIMVDKKQKGDQKKEKLEGLESLSDQYSYDLDIICGYDDENILLVKHHEIFYIESLSGGVLIHTKDKVLKGNKSLNFYEEKLKKQLFFKTHKCFIANLMKAEKIKPRINYTYDMYFMEKTDTIPVSRNKVRELKQYFN